MLNRDFTKSNKEYFKSNYKVLIAIAVFLLACVLVFALMGMNGNFEMRGYNEFTISVNEKIADNYAKHQREIGDIINSYSGEFDTLTIYGEGDDTKYVVRYMKDLSNNEQIEVNALVAEKLDVHVQNVSEHVEVSSIVKSMDYIYTAVSILLIIVVATIFCYARYNGASAISIIISCLLGSLMFIGISTILRLRIGISYFAMLVLLNLLICYIAINLFETMHKASWLAAGDYSNAINSGMKSTKNRMIIISFGILLIGLVFALFATSAMKYLSVNLMFMAVTLLAVGLYLLPFTWSVFITLSRRRTYKIKSTETETTK